MAVEPSLFGQYRRWLRGGCPTQLPYGALREAWLGLGLVTVEYSMGRRSEGSSRSRLGAFLCNVTSAGYYYRDRKTGFIQTRSHVTQP